nr:MAG TPA: hypothetical protein [Caudoviricetes sp.]
MLYCRILSYATLNKIALFIFISFLFIYLV